MPMRLELCKANDGAHFTIRVLNRRREIMIPLSPKLSEAIDRMVQEEGIKAPLPFLPPGLAPPQ